MNVARLLDRAGRSAGERPALAKGEQILCDYATLARRAAIFGGALTERFDLRPGDRVALILKNGPEYLEALYGCWWAGLAAVPMNAKLHPAEFAYMLENAGASLALVSPELAEGIAAKAGDLPGLKAILPTEGKDFAALRQGDPAPLAEAGEDALAWLFYTSGTTGKPKGAMLTHGNLMAMTLCYFSDVDAIAPTDCILHAAPMSHGSGLYNLPHIAQAALHIVPESGGFDPAEVFSLLERYSGLTAFFAPTMVGRLTGAPGAGDARTENLKSIVYGGGPMYVADLKRAIETFGQKFVQIYGQGESPMTITSLPKWMHADSDHPRYEARLASVGRPMTDIEVMVADGEDRPLPTGEAGEVLVRGRAVMPGYWQNPEATEKTLRGGWLHTGDMGALDDDGFLTLKDRSKDVIISGGSNIYPREIEEVLLKHPQVAECSVIGAPDPDWGEVVVAYLVGREGQRPAERELDELCLSEIARFKRPKAYRFLDALPKNNYGKVLKTELRKLSEEPA